MSTQSPVWGTVQDAAVLRGISVWTIRRYISQGLIQAERVGPRMIRVNLASLEHLGRPLQYITPTVDGGAE